MKIAKIGSLCFGVVVGYLVFYFIRRFTTFTPQVFGSLLSIIVGGAMTKFFEADATVRWFYPIGLLFGCIAYIVLFRLGGFPTIQQ